MVIQIRPTEDYIQEDYDLDEDNDRASFLSGYDTDEQEIEDGDTFEIPEDCIGEIQDDEDYFYKPDCDSGYYEELVETLDPGKYRLKGHYIEVL